MEVDLVLATAALALATAEFLERVLAVTALAAEAIAAQAIAAAA